MVISQDTSRYGSDLKEQKTIVDLLKELLKIKEFIYIRLLYLYPDEISDELILLMAKEKRLTPYFDIPIQHSSSRILSLMHRRGDEVFLRNLFKKIRTLVPNAILRTTLIVGFPSETEEDFQQLVSFIKEIEFDHLGVFTYSKEDKTKSYELKDDVSKTTKEQRKKILMEVQQKISYKRNKMHINEISEGLIVGYSKDKKAYKIRNYWNAPDEIDGEIYLYADKEFNEGDFVKFKIIDADVYDLFATLI